MQRLVKSWKYVVVVAAVAGVAAAGYLTRVQWTPWLLPTKPGKPVSSGAGETSTIPDKVIVSDQAIQNLRLTSGPLKAQTFWKSIEVPGMVVDRPGFSDRGIVTPATGVVSAIYHFPGETVRTGDPLFTLKLLSEPLHLTQTDLFKATQDIKLVQAQRKRLEAASGAVSEARVIEVANQITRLEVASKAYRQELQTRGLSPEQIDDVAEGKFVGEIPITAPPRPAGHKPLIMAAAKETAETPPEPPPSFEVQELKVELGQQVQAGQTLCILANHQLLAIEGRAFPDETPLLEQSVKEGWPVEVDFQEARPTPLGSAWPAADQTFHIRHLANTIDPVNRTFAFLLPLENQSRVVERDGGTQLLWRFRPGQKVRLHVRVEKLDDVFVLPADAVAHEGSEAFVFTQNVNTFERKSVRVLLRDRQRVVVVNDGGFPPGTYVVLNVAAQLNRMLKSQTSSVPKGYHVHADGSLHKNEDDEK